MNRTLIGILTLVCAIALVNWRDFQSAVMAQNEKTDKEILQGTWTLMSGKADGQDFPKELEGKVRIAFKGDQAVIADGGPLVGGPFTIDQKKKTLLIKIRGEGACLYKVEGDQLTICLTVGRVPPADFKAEKGSKAALLVFKRGGTEVKFAAIAAEPTFELKGLNRGPAAIAFSRDGKLLAAITRSYGGGFSSTKAIPGKFVVWDLASRKAILEHTFGLDGEKDAIGGDAISFHPDNRLLALSTRSSKVFAGKEEVNIWDVVQKKEVQRVPGQLGTFCSTGDYLAVKHLSFTVSIRINLVDTKTWKTARALLLPGSSGCASLAFCPRGDMIAALYDDHPSAEELKVREKQPDTVAIWKTTGGLPIETIQVKNSKGIDQFAWSPDGTKLALAIKYNSVRIWDRNKQMEIRKIDSDVVIALAFRPDGKKLATQMPGWMYKVLDLQNNEELNFMGQSINRSVFLDRCVAFGPDGQFLAGGSDNGVCLWLLK